MGSIAAVHSFRAGVGRSTIIANIAALLAAQGRRVGVVDACLYTPAVQHLLGLDEQAVPCSFHTYLAGMCELWQATYDVTSQLGKTLPGRVYLTPSRPESGQISHIRREGYDPVPLTHDLRRLIERLSLDVLLLDMESGLDTGTIALFAVLDTLLVALRHDKRDYQGTGLIVEIARRLPVPRVLLMANEVPPRFDPLGFEQQAKQTYGCAVVGIVPHIDEMTALEGSALFALRHPEHPVTATLRSIGHALVQLQ